MQGAVSTFSTRGSYRKRKDGCSPSFLESAAAALLQDNGCAISRRPADPAPCDEMPASQDSPDSDLPQQLSFLPHTPGAAASQGEAPGNAFSSLMNVNEQQTRTMQAAVSFTVTYL